MKTGDKFLEESQYSHSSGLYDMDIREIVLSRPHCLHGCQESEKMHVHDTESPHRERTYVQLKEQREVSLLMSFCLLSFPAEKWPAGQPLCTGKQCAAAKVRQQPSRELLVKCLQYSRDALREFLTNLFNPTHIINFA